MTLQALLVSALIPWLVPHVVPPPPPPTAAARERAEERQRVVELLSASEHVPTAAARERTEERRRVVELLSANEYVPTASGVGIVVRDGVPVASLDRASAAAVPSIDDEDVSPAAATEPIPPLPAPPLDRTVRVGPTQTIDGPLSLSATQVFLASSAVMPHKAPTLRVRGPGSSIQLGLPVVSLDGKDVLVDCVGKFPDKLRVGVVWVSWDGAVKAWDAMVLSNLDDRAKFVISPGGLPAKGKLWIQLRQGKPNPPSWEITECSVTAVH
jgi:hypothetical protein